MTALPSKADILLRLGGSNGTGDRSLRKSFRPVGLLASDIGGRVRQLWRNRKSRGRQERSATNRSRVDDRAASEQARLGQRMDLVLVFPVARRIPALSSSDATDWG